MKRSRILSVVVALSAAAFVASAAAYDVKPEKGGNIKGKVVFKGDVSKANQKIKPDKDPNVCAEHTAPDFEVGEGGGLKNAVVYLKKVEKGKEWPAEMEKCVIDQIKCVYSGHVSFVKKGGEVVFRSTDDVLHNIKATSASYSFNETVTKGNDLVKKCDKADKVKLSCSVHPWMSGVLYVVNHPYYTATNEKGEFTLTNVNPGKYTLMCEHERLKKPEGEEKGVEVEVKADGDATHDFTFTKIPE